jgi:ribosomal protein S6
MKLYEGMFVIDNDLVREDWQAAKAVVTDTLEKHGAKIHSARRWDERALAYPIKGRRRATYLLTYFEIEGERNADVSRSLEIQDGVLRYLITAAAEVPESELEASREESADGFQVPPPPADSVGTYRPLQGDEEESEDSEEGDGEQAGSDKEEKGEKSEGEKSEGEKSSGTPTDGDAGEAKAEPKADEDTKEQG